MLPAITGDERVASVELRNAVPIRGWPFDVTLNEAAVAFQQGKVRQ